jgi:hypothetical protein
MEASDTISYSYNMINWPNENEETIRNVHTNGKPVMD